MLTAGHLDRQQLWVIEPIDSIIYTAPTILQGDRGHPRQVGHARSFGMHLPRAVGTERCLLPGASLVQGWCPDLRQGR